MSADLGRKVWTSAPPPQRPFRVCDHKRTTRKGLTAATRQELLDKASESSPWVPRVGAAKGLVKREFGMMSRKSCGYYMAAPPSEG